MEFQDGTSELPWRGMPASLTRDRGLELPLDRVDPRAGPKEGMVGSSETPKGRISSRLPLVFLFSSSTCFPTSSKSDNWASGVSLSYPFHVRASLSLPTYMKLPILSIRVSEIIMKIALDMILFLDMIEFIRLLLLSLMVWIICFLFNFATNK